MSLKAMKSSYIDEPSGRSAARVPTGTPSAARTDVRCMAHGAVRNERTSLGAGVLRLHATRNAGMALSEGGFPRYVRLL
jgi:hypothetical protein